MYCCSPVTNSIPVLMLLDPSRLVATVITVYLTPLSSLSKWTDTISPLLKRPFLVLVWESWVMWYVTVTVRLSIGGVPIMGRRTRRWAVVKLICLNVTCGGEERGTVRERARWIISLVWSLNKLMVACIQINSHSTMNMIAHQWLQSRFQVYQSLFVKREHHFLSLIALQSHFLSVIKSSPMLIWCVQPDSLSPNTPPVVQSILMNYVTCNIHAHNEQYIHFLISTDQHIKHSLSVSHYTCHGQFPPIISNSLTQFIVLW